MPVRNRVKNTVPVTETLDQPESQSAKQAPAGMFAKEACMSGLLAAMAAAFGKVAFSNDSFIVPFVSNTFAALGPAYFSLIEGSCRLIVFMLMMGSNALMLAYFLEALEKENSSLMVTAISTSVNFVSTGVIGNFFFVEPVSSTWYGGALLTSCGAALISFSQKSPPVERNKPI